MGSLKNDTYSLGHDEGIIAHHERRRVVDAAGYLLPALRETYGAPAKAQLKFLDVGCGPASITIDFAQNYYPASHFTAIDYTNDALDRARAAAQSKPVTNITFQLGDVQNLAFADDEFDVVYCSQVLQHLSDPVKALSEMRRVCKTGGVVGAKEGASATWYPPLPGLQAKWDLTQKLSRARGSTPDPGARIHVFAYRAGFRRDQVRCSGDVWVFSTPEERRFFGGNWVKRLDPDVSGASAFVHNVLDGEFATRDELRAMRDDFRRWMDDEDGLYAYQHGEIVCRK